MAAVPAPKVLHQPSLPERLGDPALYARMQDLTLSARTIADGALKGLHRARRHGSSIVFKEHTLYVPGDDVRHIDWRVHAKTDRTYIKRFEDETNLRVTLWIDCSASMGFGEGPQGRKLDVAVLWAAALAHIVLRQHDAAGIAGFADGAATYVRPSSHPQHMSTLLQALARMQPHGSTHFVPSIDQLLRTDRRRAAVVLLTDLYGNADDVLAAARAARAHHRDVSIIHLLDPNERDFPYEVPTWFADMERDARLFVAPRVLRRAYQTQLNTFVERIQTACAESNVLFQTMMTDAPVADSIVHYLRQRRQGPR